MLVHVNVFFLVFFLYFFRNDLLFVYCLGELYEILLEYSTHFLVQSVKREVPAICIVKRKVPAICIEADDYVVFFQTS